MDEAIKLADRIVILKAGEIVQVGTPDEILRNPANEFVEEFIGKERLIQSRPDIERVEQMMNRTPVTVSADKTLSQAIQLMREKRVDSLLVVDRQNVLKGYVDVEMIDQNRKSEHRWRCIPLRYIYRSKRGATSRYSPKNFEAGDQVCSGRR